MYINERGWGANPTKKNSASLQAYPSFRRLRIMCLPVLPYEDYMCL